MVLAGGVCVVVGAIAIVIVDWLVLREGLALMDAFAAEAGATPDTPRRYSVSILFGLIPIEDTPYPYLWFALGSALTGSGLGLAAWGLIQAALWVWRRARRRRVGGPAEAGATPGPRRQQRKLGRRLLVRRAANASNCRGFATCPLLYISICMPFSCLAAPS